MSRTKQVQTFLILLLTMIIAVVIVYSSCPVLDEEPGLEVAPTFVEISEDPPTEENDSKLIVLEVAVPEEKIEEPKSLTQQEEIELHIQNIVSLYPNLSTNLINAVIWRESRYDPNVKNYNGTCVGLMQLSIKWHSDRAQKLGVKDLYDPYGNILTGCDLLSELLESYSLEMALMTYHGGYPYAQKHQEAGTIDQYTKDILSYAKQLEEVT